MLGKQIKRMRTAAGISQQEMANRLEVSKQSVCNWENGNIVPSIKILRKICQMFSCSADYLLELSDEKHMVLDVSELTDKQVAHISAIVDDFKAINKLSED